MKKVIIAVVVLAAVVLTLPLWGGCDLNARACNAWCSVRHLNAEFKEAGCKARCETERLRCHAGAAGNSVDDFFEGYRNK